jgi:hypothetical protein
MADFNALCAHIVSYMEDASTSFSDYLLQHFPNHTIFGVI